MFRHVLYALAAVACLMPLGCGRKAADSSDAKYKIAVVPKGLTHEFWQSIHRGALRAAADLSENGVKVEVLWEGPLTEDAVRDQTNIVQQMIGGHRVHGLVLAPQHSKAMVPVVKEAVDRGVPVVIIDSGLEDASLFVKYVATNNYNGGRMAARRLLDVLAKQGKKAPKLVLFRYDEGSESTEQREKGFLAEVAEHGAAKVISDDVYAGATVTSAQAKAGPLLQSVKGEADGIFAVNESCATGMLNAMRSEKLNQKIRLVAFDSSEPLLQAVEDGDVDGLIVQDPYRMGYLGVWTLVRHLEGDDVVAGDKYLPTGEFLLTKENVKEDEARQRFDRALQAKRAIAPPAFGRK